MGGGSKSVSLQCSSQGYFPAAALAEATVRGSQKDKIAIVLS